MQQIPASLSYHSTLQKHTVMEKKLIAYHGDPKIKEFYLARVRAHRLADQIIQGTGWDEASQRGCAVGCTLHSYNHSAYEKELGLHRILARLQDGIFENLPIEEAQEFPLKFLSAIEPGADLSGVWLKFAIWMLIDETHGVLQFAKSERSRKAIELVADAYRRGLASPLSVEEWGGIRSAAYAAAYAAADAAADANADANAKKIDWRRAQAKKLLELLASAPIYTEK